MKLRMDDQELNQLLDELDKRPAENWKRKDQLLSIDYHTVTEKGDVIIQRWQDGSKTFDSYSDEEKRKTLLRSIGKNPNENYEFSVYFDDEQVFNSHLIVRKEDVKINPLAKRMLMLFDNLEKEKGYAKEKPFRVPFVGTFY